MVDALWPGIAVPGHKSLTNRGGRTMSKKQKGFVEYVKSQYLKRGIIIDRVKVFGRTICLYAAGEIVYSIERRA